MQCPACSTENPAGALYCQKCGTALGAAPAEPAPDFAAGTGYKPVGGYSQVPQSGPVAAPSGAAYVPATSGGLSDNVAAAVAYLTFIPAIIFLALQPYNTRPFVRFHAFQCLALTVASVVLHFAVGLMVFALHAFTFVLSSLISLVFFVLWLICIVSAAQGKWFKVPLLGDLAEQQSRR